jgi:hypothetical protein
MSAAQVGSILVGPPESYEVAWGDYDNDGDPDVCLQNYEGPNQLHHNDGRGFFTQTTVGSISQVRSGGLMFWGDHDNDGFLDLFAGGGGLNGPFTNALHWNRSGLNFTNVAASAGVGAPIACWAAAWGDFDNDGWLDIFAMDCDWGGGISGPNVLFHNRGDGTFEPIDVGSPIRDGSTRIVVTWADYDNDGFLDLFLGCGEPDQCDHLYRNNGRAIGNANHWLKLKLNGQASNRSGIGAKIRVKATIRGQEIWQVREITGNGHAAAGPGLIAHFGLGNSVQATTIRIEWPSGIVQEFTNVPAGQPGEPSLVITEHQNYPPPNPPPRFNGASPSSTGCQLSIGEPAAGFCYCLEASIDLATWTKLMVRTSAGGTYDWVDEQASSQPTRFYRLVVP